jgi:crooked neck
LENDDAEKVREVYKACLDVIPHKSFTFAKVWLLFAQFEIRQKNLQGARKVLVSSQISCFIFKKS